MGMGLEANDLSTRRANYFEHIEHGAEPEPLPEVAAWPIQMPMSAVLPPPPPPPVTNSKDLALPGMLTQRLKERWVFIFSVIS